MKELIKALKQARKQLHKEAEALPDEDAFATPYSLLSDVATAIDSFMKEIDPALKEAKAFSKECKEPSSNRAKKWCQKP